LGTLLKVDKSLSQYDQTDGNYFLWHPENTDAVYKVNNDKINCQNCPNDENENVTVDTKQEIDSVVTTTVTVNGEVVTVNKTGTKKGLSVDKDGVIIKTK
jgi:hypothetical protein